VNNPRREAAAAGKPASSTRRAPARKPSRKPAPRGRDDLPQRTSFKGILLRAGVVAALFYPYMIFIGGVSAAAALYVAVFAFLILIPLGFLMDMAFYKIRMRRYERRKAGG
jgi:hypothetical protein